MGKLFAPERLAGIWGEGELQVVDSGAMEAFINKYEVDRAKLKGEGIILPLFEAYLK